jgi:hypothetical protein
MVLEADTEVLTSLHDFLSGYSSADNDAYSCSNK